MNLPACTAPDPAPIAFSCPRCQRALLRADDSHRCGDCGQSFPVHQGVHCFYLDSGDPGNLRAYTRSFQRLETAVSYARSFEEVPRKRWRTRRELAVLSALLEDHPGERVLNIPCGSGRLSPPLLRPGGVLLEADSSPDQISLNRERHGEGGGRVFLTASAFDIPLPDNAVDTVVCARLSHHLDEAGQREQLLAELLRVASARVVFSFRNHASLPVWSRRLRGRRAHATAMRIAEVRALAARHGGRLLRWRSVSNLGARHTYALIASV